MAEGCSFEAYVFRCTCAERGQLQQFYEVTQPENLSRLEFRWLSSGRESVPVFWATVCFSHIKNVRRFTTLQIVTCWKTSVGESWAILYRVPIWHKAIYMWLCSGWSTCQNIVSSAVKTPNVHPSRYWDSRNMGPMLPRCTNFSHAKTSASTVKGTMLKKIQLILPKWQLHYFLTH
jgi:hypothetical protein